MSAETLAALAVALAAGWASGLNTYAAVLVLGAGVGALGAMFCSASAGHSLKK